MDCFIPGVEDMGFLWSMQAEDGSPPGTYYFKKDIPNPDSLHLYVVSGHVTLKSTKEINRCNVLCNTPHERYYIAPGVHRTIIKEGRIRGSMYLPPGISLKWCIIQY